MDSVFKLESNDSFQKAVTYVLKQNHTSRQYSSAELSTNMVEAAKEDLRKLLITVNFDVNELCKQLLTNSSWNQDRVKQFISLLMESKTEVLQSVLTHYNSMFGDTVLDCMWSLKLVLGKSELKVLRYPFMQLVLSTVNSNDQVKQKLYELNRETLLLLIKKIENGLGMIEF